MKKKISKKVKKSQYKRKKKIYRKRQALNFIIFLIIYKLSNFMNYLWTRYQHN